MHHNDELQLNLGEGVLSSAIFRPSPHHDERPENAFIDLIVVHCISLPKGVYGTESIEKFFCGELDFNEHQAFAEIARLRVSAHLLIKRNGEIVQFVPFHKRAWHAGASFFQGRFACNDFSIGIELEGTDDTPFTEQQYANLAHVIMLLRKHYPAITHDRIVGHQDIAPQRKTDPGRFFDWAYLQRLLLQK